jgi:hypothetical protein
MSGRYPKAPLLLLKNVDKMYESKIFKCSKNYCQFR